MTFNPDNLIFFYLTLGLLALAIAVALYATRGDSKRPKRPQ
jgi:hypothetical protein